MTEFNNVFVKKRKELKLNRQEVANALGVPRKTVLEWEKGANVPDSVMLFKISELFNMDMRELVVASRTEIAADRAVCKKERIISIRNASAIILPIAIVMLISSVITGVCISRALSENNATAPIQTQYETIINKDGIMRYKFGTNKMEASFKFIPQHSGRYRLSKGYMPIYSAYDKLEITAGGVQVQNGYTDYYNKDDEYIFHLKFSDSEFFERYVRDYFKTERIVLTLNVEEVNPPAKLDILGNDDYMFKFYVRENGFYTIETGGLNYKLSDDDSDDIKPKFDDIYFLYDGWHTMILEAQSSVTTIDFSVNKKDDFDDVTVDKSVAFEPIKFYSAYNFKRVYKVDIKTSDNYTLLITRLHTGFNSNIKCYLMHDSGDWVDYSSNAYTASNGKLCFEYKFYNLRAGAYYLVFEIAQDFYGEFAFS